MFVWDEVGLTAIIVLCNTYCTICVVRYLIGVTKVVLFFLSEIWDIIYVMDYSIIFYVLIIVGIGAVIFLQTRKKPEPKKDDSAMLMLQQQINQISQVLDKKLSESNKNQQFQFNQSAKIIGDVRERLAKLDETNRQVVTFADQLQSLQDILKNPKQRGIL